mgnify:CR=1 FL=1
MKKKYTVSYKDKEDWINFIESREKINPKGEDFLETKEKKEIVPKLDLHGFTLQEANKIVEKFIDESFINGNKKIIIITGKGLRSKTQDNPYISEKLNVLRYSVPEFIKGKKDLNSKVINITKAEIKDGGEGALYIFLRKNRNL